MQRGRGPCVRFGVLITFNFSQGDKTVEKLNSEVIITVIIIGIKAG